MSYKGCNFSKYVESVKKDIMRLRGKKLHYQHKGDKEAVELLEREIAFLYNLEMEISDRIFYFKEREAGHNDEDESIDL